MEANRTSVVNSQKAQPTDNLNNQCDNCVETHFPRKHIFIGKPHRDLPTSIQTRDSESRGCLRMGHNWPCKAIIVGTTDPGGQQTCRVQYKRQFGGDMDERR